MLRREGTLEEWSDHAIIAGALINQTVRKSLNESRLFIALLSPDYLASNYCYEEEFEHALKLHRAGRMRIIPVILEPCDWLSSPFREFLALPKDGQPISEWTNQNNAFLNVVTGLRRVVAEGFSEVHESEATLPSETQPTRLRRPRIKQDFDAIQRVEFADRAFEIIQAYFKSACREIHDVDGQIRARFEEMSKTAFTATVVNRGRRNNGESHITIHNTKGRRGAGDISYVYERYADSDTSNGWISVEADEYNLFLSQHGGFRSSDDGDGKLSPEQVADRLWNEFVAKAGIEYE